MHRQFMCNRSVQPDNEDDKSRELNDPDTGVRQKLLRAEAGLSCRHWFSPIKDTYSFMSFVWIGKG